MIVDVITVLPSIFDAPMGASMLGIAQERGVLDLRIHDLRQWTHDRHRTTDDSPYGGGPGMVMKPEPIVDAVESIQARVTQPGYVVFLTPAGRVFDQALARQLAAREHIVLVCGRYEGFDERAMAYADLALSVGDYVLTGGEIPAMLVVDAVTRLQPGVLGDERSSVEESFAEGLLEYPQYTRPAVFRDLQVPEVLLGGDHARIERWRREQAIRKTARLRPDLLERASLTPLERALAEDETARAAEPEEGIEA